MNIATTTAIAAIAGLATAAAASVPVTKLFQEGDAIAGSTVSSVNAAFTSGNGTVGTVGILDDGRRFIWINNGVDYTTDLFPENITGAESSMGVADDGTWAASFSLPFSGTSGTDDSWFHSSNQTIAREFDPFPFIPNQIVGLAMEAVDAADINDNGNMVAIFDVGTSSTDEALVYGSDAADNSTWEVILRVGDSLDFDNDGMGDGTLLDFNISGTITPFELCNTAIVWHEVDYEDLNGAEFEALIGVTIPAPASAAFLALAGLATTRRRR